MQSQERTFERFMAEVKESLEQHARRKGYNDSGANGKNQLYDFCVEIGAEPGHTAGECIYKLTEFLHEPREVLPLKVAAWVYLLWRETPRIREARDLPLEDAISYSHTFHAMTPEQEKANKEVNDRLDEIVAAGRCAR